MDETIDVGCPDATQKANTTGEILRPKKRVKIIYVRCPDGTKEPGLLDVRYSATIMESILLQPRL